MNIYNTIFALILLFSFTASAKGTEINVVSQQLNFAFISEDGAISLQCRHSQIRDLPDWEVVCGKGTKHERKFAAHFVVHKLERAVPPYTSYEFLYTVTDRNSTKPKFNSSSFIMNLKNQTEVHGLRFHQGVENDWASLVVDYSP